MEYLRRLVGRARRQRHRLQVLQHAVSPNGSVARLFLRSAIATHRRALRHRRGGYPKWIELFDELTQDDRQEIAQRMTGGPAPVISVVLVLRPQDSAADVARLVHSLQAQLWSSWELTILVAPDCEAAVADEVVGLDRRVRSERCPEGGVWPNLPREHLLLLLSPGVLREHALYSFVRAATSGVHVVYCDGDRVDAAGVRSTPEFRPAFSPTLARQTNYFGPCIYFRASERLVGVDIANELEVSRSIADCDDATVTHVPFILFHQTVEREPAVKPSEIEDVVRSVSIIIPTRDRVGLLKACIDSIRSRTDYPAESIEIVVVDNGSVEPATLAYLHELGAKPGAQVVRDDGPFNYSRLNNLAARRARGEVFVLLNNDIVIEDPRWLRRLISHVVASGVGAVGGKLLYPDRTVQHGGVILGVGAGARHAQLYLPENAPGYLGQASLDREVTAVTAACLAIRRDVFKELGGLDESLAISFNDVTLCVEARRRGYRNVCIATPLAIHFESKSRGFDDTPERIALARSELVSTLNRYRGLFRNDPFYSPNLSEDGTYALAFPPRAARPWRRGAGEGEARRRVVLLGEARLGPAIAAGLRAQASALMARGHDVVIGAVHQKSAPYIDGCRRVVVRSPDEAAEFAFRFGADCVVVHSSPFFAVARWLGTSAKLVAMNYGADGERDAPASITTHNGFWQAWADSIVSMEANAAPTDIAALIERLCVA